MRTLDLRQNFLKNRRTARKLVHLSGATAAALTVDFGAGKGFIADEILDMVGGPVLVVEKDPRLVQFLTEKYRDRPQVQVCAGDIRDVPLPTEPFVIAANIPFNVSTHLVRRWMSLPNFRQGALLIEREFGLRLAGHFGLTKLSASLGAAFNITVPMRVDPAQFHPRPRANIAIMQVTRREVPLVSLGEIERYWAFVNYLFERGQFRIGESLAPLRLGLPAQIAATTIAEAGLPLAVDLFQRSLAAPHRRAWDLIVEFNCGLAQHRRPLSPRGDLPLPPRPPTLRPAAAPRTRRDLGKPRFTSC